MSGLTPCNYCTLLDIRRRAREADKIVTVRAGSVFVHKEGEAPVPWPEEGKDTKSNQVAWMAEIGASCDC